METIAWTSRSIQHNKLRQREMIRKYSNHKNTIEGIKRQKSHPVFNIGKQLVQINQTHKKLKETAKNFRKAESQSKIVKQNRILLEKIYYVESNFKTINEEKFKYVSGSALNYKKQKANLIKQQNKKIGIALQAKQNDLKDYKKKMQQEIKQYLILRNQIRKMKIQNKSKDKKPKTTRSDTKKSQFMKMQQNEQDVHNKHNTKQSELEENAIAISSINQNVEENKNIPIELLESQS